MPLEHAAECGWLPDPLLRHGIRRLVAERLRSLDLGCEGEREEQERFLEELRHSPIALHTREANAQHYEVPAAFFELVLGRRLKYSCADWSGGVATLDEAEEAMLHRTAERAGLADGQRILELGCGWGSLTLWVAERFPASRIVAVSNSPGQRAFIEARAAERGLGNVEVRTADMNELVPDGRFDRVLSVEMFEHMRNWEALLGRIHGWLEPEGRLFVHVFCHRSRPYLFTPDGKGDWMARHFFTGGLMPSDDLLLRLRSPLRVERHWRHSGHHYRQTAEAWLRNLDRNRAPVLAIFRRTYGDTEARRWFGRWRIFFLACAELFGWEGGDTWWVSHYRLRPGEGR